MLAVVAEEVWANTRRGRIFAKHWRCENADRSAAVPIVLFHDSLGCVELWREFPARLAAATGRSVIAYDRLGFGKSGPHPGKLDGGFVREEAHETFSELREQLRIEKFVAFGHSVGGGMAVACASAGAADCWALMTESAQAFVEDRTLAGIREAQQGFAQSGQLERLEKYHGDKAAWVLSAWIDTWLSPGFLDWNLDEDLGRVRCPVLVIHGDQDEYGSVRHPERIARLTAPNSTIEILRGCGHVPHRERGDVVVELVRNWLERTVPQFSAGPV